MPRLTKDQWLEARQAWESSPTLTYAALAEKIMVSHTAVMKVAKRDGWVKSGSLDSINRAAQIKADASEVSEKVSGETTKKAGAASVEASTDLRAKLIHAHRAEWRKHAALFPLDGVKENFDTGKSAKISAEMLAIRQKGERVAWGMDEAKTEAGTDLSAIAADARRRLGV